MFLRLRHQLDHRLFPQGLTILVVRIRDCILFLILRWAARSLMLTEILRRLRHQDILLVILTHPLHPRFLPPLLVLCIVLNHLRTLVQRRKICLPPDSHLYHLYGLLLHPLVANQEANEAIHVGRIIQTRPPSVRNGLCGSATCLATQRTTSYGASLRSHQPLMSRSHHQLTLRPLCYRRVFYRPKAAIRWVRRLVFDRTVSQVSF